MKRKAGQPGFRIFTGNSAPHQNLAHLPEAPEWRRFVRQGEEASDKLDPKSIPAYEPTHRERALAERYQVDNPNQIVDAVNAALHLRRPLLVTGPAGTGKSSLAYAVARELQLGPVLVWSITSKSTLREGLYDYDALGRLQAIQEKKRAPIADYVKLGPLGTAMLPARWPKALLIDEIDKADLDLPNDLLNLFEEGRYTIEELRRAKAGSVNVATCHDVYGNQPVADGRVACTVFPFVVLTSNGEREFSAPFLRRCVRLEVKAPGVETLKEIVKGHLGAKLGVDLEEEASEFLKRRGEQKLSTDQLLNAIYILERTGFAGDKKDLLKLLYRELE